LTSARREALAVTVLTFEELQRKRERILRCNSQSNYLQKIVALNIL